MGWKKQFVVVLITFIAIEIDVEAQESGNNSLSFGANFSIFSSDYKDPNPYSGLRDNYTSIPAVAITYARYIQIVNMFGLDVKISWSQIKTKITVTSTNQFINNYCAPYSMTVTGNTASTGAYCRYKLPVDITPLYIYAGPTVSYLYHLELEFYPKDHDFRIKENPSTLDTDIRRHINLPLFQFDAGTEIDFKVYGQTIALTGSYSFGIQKFNNDYYPDDPVTIEQNLKNTTFRLHSIKTSIGIIF